MAIINTIFEKLDVFSIPVLIASGFLLVLYFVVQTVWQYRKLRHFHGPPGAGFSKWWLFKNQYDGKMNLVLGEVSKKYGSLARIGPQELLTDDPEIIRRMTGARSKYTRSNWYDAARLGTDKDNVLSQRDEEKHMELRTKMAAGYSGKEVVDLEKSVDRQIANMIHLLNTKYADKTCHIDFARTAEYFTLDVISDIAYGEAFGFLANDSDLYDYIKMSEEAFPLIIQIGVFPILTAIIQNKIVNNFIMPSVKDNLGLGRIMGIVREVIAARYGPKKISRNDMLGSFVHHGLTQEEAESEVLIQILAGSDTTATAIRMTLLHLITSPSAYDKLLAELLSAAQSGRISSPVKESEGKSLPYLQACIKEGLRIHPPVSNLSLKEVPKEGDTINGYYIPPGTRIATSFWGLFRNTKIWGDDAHVFRPERWIEVDSEKRHVMEGTLDMAFSWGRYQCLGKPIAYLELNKVFVELLRHFNFAIGDPMKPLMYNQCVGIFIQRKMYLKVTKREVQF